jgi:hypothetical protein
MTDETPRDAASNDNANTPAPSFGAQDASGVPAQAGTPLSHPPEIPKESGGEMKADIQKILADIHLPERRDVAGEHKAPPAQIPVPPTLSTLDAPIRPADAPEAVKHPEEDPVIGVHTLKQDLQHVVQQEKISLVRAVALEEEKRRAPAEAAPVSRQSSKARGILFAIIILLLLGIAAIIGVYYTEFASHTPPAQTASTILFAEQSVSLPITGQSAATLKATLAGARNASSASLGSITRIVPIVGTTDQDARPATLSEFLAAIGAQPPDDLLRALSDDFFVGLHTVDKNAPLFVIPVTSYDRAFAGMLTWEHTINTDLSPFFTSVPPFTNASGIPTDRAFSDVVMRNYDVRALKDDAGQIELYYSFPTRNLLIIAESPYTFAEVLTRLQASRALQ